VLAVVFLFIQHNRFELIHDYDRLFTKDMFKYAIPLIPVSVLMWANTSVPQLVMQKTMDYHSIGIFTSAVALANIVLIIQSGFNIFWLPYTYENYKTQTGQFFKVHRYLLCVLTICSLFLVLSQDLVFLILGEKYREAKCFFPFLILTPVCYIIAETTGMGIDISKKTYFNIVVFGCSVFVNILFCLILKNIWGVPGIAIAVALAGITSMCVKTYIGQKYYKAVDNYRYIYLTVGLILISSIITLMVESQLYKLSLLLLLFLCSVLFFRREIVELKNYALTFVKK
jgi:O-antigen/teichoic acid export membrane protein